MREKQVSIMTQMPMPHTIVDFWKLVYEQEITTIVMLNESIDEVSVS